MVRKFVFKVIQHFQCIVTNIYAISNCSVKFDPHAFIPFIACARIRRFGGPLFSLSTRHNGTLFIALFYSRI